MIYDVIVVGAGPAGSVFAATLADGNKNIKILLIDGQSEKNKKVCGGLLAPDAQKLFAKFDLILPVSVLADPQIFAVETIDLALECKRYYQRHYMNMDRFAFDQYLLSRVPSDVEIICARCEGISEQDGIYELDIRQNGELKKVSSRAVVGADGASSVVRRHLYGADMKQYVAIQEIFECRNEEFPYYSCIFDKNTSDSCSWTIRKDDKIIFGGAFKKKSSRESFALQKKRFESFMGIDFGNPIRTEACLLTSPRRFCDFKVGKNGVYLIGEAAGFISASSFEGISSAIISGELLAKAYLGGDEKKILRLYKKSVCPLKLKLYFKIQKRRVLCSPFLRACIMKSGIRSLK